MKKRFLALLALAGLAAPTCAAVDEGIVTWVDGKGAFQVEMKSRGTIVLNANNDLMADELEFKPRRWPHRYKDLKAGDYISVDWGRDPKSGKNIAFFLGIRKRGS